MDFEKELRQALDGSDALIGDSYINAISDLFIKLIEEQQYYNSYYNSSNGTLISKQALINAIKGTK